MSFTTIDSGELPKLLERPSRDASDGCHSDHARALIAGKPVLGEVSLFNLQYEHATCTGSGRLRR